MISGFPSDDGACDVWDALSPQERAAAYAEAEAFDILSAALGPSFWPPGLADIASPEEARVLAMLLDMAEYAKAELNLRLAPRPVAEKAQHA